MARLSDSAWMGRFVERVGSQRAAAAQLGVSPSMVSKVVRGLRSGERYRDAARAGASGRKVTPPPPTAKTPRRVRRSARIPTTTGGSRIVAKSAGVFGREIGRSRAAGRVPRGLTVTLTDVDRSAQYRHKGPGKWSGALGLTHLTSDQIDRLANGTIEDVLSVLREEHPWLGSGRISGVTFED